MPEIKQLQIKFLCGETHTLDIILPDEFVDLADFMAKSDYLYFDETGLLHIKRPYDLTGSVN